MAQAVRVYETGGPETLRLEEVAAPPPGPGEVTLRQTAIGVNFIDVYHRTGLYKLPIYPSGIGLEAAGVVEQAGKGAEFRPGDRVAYCGGPPGAYAAHRTMASKHLVRLPEDISDEVAAAIMLKGLTAHYLLRLTYPVTKGDAILIHAAAGGVGLIACQWARYLGAKVLGTVGSDDKAAIARAHGCDSPIVYTREDFVQKVREHTGGEGVAAVYDSVGKTTFDGSLDCLRKFGTLVSFGQSSGAIPPFDPAVLAQKGSLYLTRPTLMHHIEDTAAYRAHARELFDLVGKGVIRVAVHRRYKLTDVRRAHGDLESRQTTGALVLVP